MNASVEQSNGAAPAKPKAEAEVVTMNDGRKVEFVGKRKMIKEHIIDDAAGTVSLRLDFRNGETRLIVLPPALLLKFAGHGAEQKYGDETASVTDDVDDMVLAIDELDARIQKGEWSTVREGGGMSGTSVLLKALLEFSGGKRTVDQLKEFLKGKTQQEKLALRAHKDVKPIVDRLEAAKVAKASKVDTDALLSAL